MPNVLRIGLEVMRNGVQWVWGMRKFMSLVGWTLKKVKGKEVLVLVARKLKELQQRNVVDRVRKLRKLRHLKGEWRSLSVGIVLLIRRVQYDVCNSLFCDCFLLL